MNSEKNWILQVDNFVDKFLAKSPKRDSLVIFEVIENLPENPFLGDIQKIKGEENSWRRRVGNYRIFYEVLPKENLIYIYEVKRRSSNTY
jgi:mRNA interferase RelE/StbE